MTQGIWDALFPVCPGGGTLDIAKQEAGVKHSNTRTGGI